MKPANILVGEDDKPKIIDFGVARAIDADTTASMHTGVGQLLGTVPYMSHEQLAGDPTAIDARADVYALGVVMYELLSGRLPYDVQGKTVAEAIGLVRDGEPAPLGTTHRILRGDLETIVGKTLDKDPDRRYPSASELAADVRRYLQNEPVTARRPSALYQVQKLARRHRAAFAATVAALVILVAGAVTASGLAVEATRQRNSAETASRALARLITEGERDGNTVIILMQDLAELVDGERIPDPQARADLHGVLGRHWHKLDHHPWSRKHLERQLAIRRVHPGPDDAGLVAALGDLAHFELSYGRLESAIELRDELLDVQHARYGEAHWVLAPNDRLRGLVLGTTLDPEEHERLSRELADLRAQSIEYAAPEPIHAPATDLSLVLMDDFDGTALHEGWSVYIENIVTWRSQVDASRFTVEAIVPEGDPRQLNGATGIVTCTRELPRLQDFTLRLACGWRGPDRETTLRTLIARLVDGHGFTVASVSATDPWDQHDGEFKAVVTNRTIAHTGYGSMPGTGEAELEIARVGDHIVFARDGSPFAAASCDVPVVEIQLVVSYTAVDRLGGRTSFGPIWVDRLEIEGVETDRKAYVVE